ncbi:MAG: ribonuclease III [Bacilli bacterium]|nr:ribonuclease III [Bacilli bacterium]
MEVNKKYNIDLNSDLIKRAFTHSSYVNETKKGEDYERLEFLGDKILDFLVSEYLYVSEHLHEGEMTKIRANYVCENALYEYSKKLNFHDYLRLGKGEEASGGRNRKAILADVFEAFIAAVYLTYGLDKAKEIIYDVVIKAIEDKEDYFLHDYKSILQELLQADKKGVEYEVINEEGPSHNKIFTSVVKIDGVMLGKGTSNSKKESEQEAAKDALSKQAKINK